MNTFEALSAYKYFENVRNFLVSVKEMGLPTFETSDLEKEAGGSLSGKVGENQKVTSSSKQFARKITDLFSSSLSKFIHYQYALVVYQKTEDFSSGGAEHENSLSKVMEEFEHRLALQKEQVEQEHPAIAMSRA
ncbi:hypothetical protein Leryth_021020 [Lithospermum erythrorhizon]|nr:hypothetical protein Leryth_021020 [Lithospermum erythrorhizon]